MIYFDVDVALSEVPVNLMPLTDDTDFKTRESGLAHNAAGMDLVWNFVTSAGVFTQTAVTPTSGGDYDWTDQGDGMYTIEIPASGGASINNDTEGYGWFTGFITGVLPWRSPIFGFRAAALNDALLDGGDNLDVNAVEISGDSTAADNLELMFDGTGYTDETAPASRAQVSGIGAGSGSALNYPVSADNTGGAIIDSVAFVGAQTGTYTNTENDLSTFHQIDDTGDAFDLVYRIDCGDIRTAVSLSVDAYLNSSNDTCNIQVYDHIGTDWETVQAISGINGSTVESFSINLFEKHTGALGTSEAGNLYVRFVTTAQSNPTLFIARVSASAVPATSTMGYEGGQVWCDETGGTSTGTTLGVDGIFANQSDDFDNAQTIADTLGTSFIHTHPGNSITLTAALQGYNISNVQCTLNGGSQNCDSTRVNGGFINGTWTRAGTGIITFVGCSIVNVTSDRCAILQSSGLVGTFTLSEAGLYPIVDAQAGGATGIATIDFASLGGATVNMEGWKGSLTIANMAAGDTLNLHAAAGGDIVLGGANGTVNISGVVASVTDNRTGSPSLTNNSVNLVTINAEIVDVLTIDTIADSYAADGNQPTFAQAVLAIQQFLHEKSVSGTTVTVNKPDGSTAAMTFTLDDASTPTSITRAS